MKRTFCALCFCLSVAIVCGQIGFLIPQFQPDNLFGRRRSSFNLQSFLPVDDGRLTGVHRQRDQGGRNQLTYPYRDEIVFVKEPNAEGDDRNADFGGVEGTKSLPIPIGNDNQVFVFSNSDENKPESEALVTADRNNAAVSSDAPHTENEGNLASNISERDATSTNPPSDENSGVNKELSTKKEETGSLHDRISSSITFETPDNTKVQDPSSTSTGLPELTPVPNVESRSTFGRGIFRLYTLSLIVKTSRAIAGPAARRPRPRSPTAPRPPPAARAVYQPLARRPPPAQSNSPSPAARRPPPAPAQSNSPSPAAVSHDQYKDDVTLSYEIKVRKETCTTAAGGLGSCIVLTACDALYSKLRERPSDGAVVSELRAAHCGFQGTDPKVCCPKAGFPETVPTELPPQTSPTTESPSGVTASLPEPPECGFSNASFSRVVGGVAAKLGDFPWMALLGYRPRRADDGPRWLCGGSLVSSRHVLTAAHCIHKHENDLYIVRLGDLDISKDDDGATPLDVPIARAEKHELYSPTAFTDDIGLLLLQHEVQFTALIRPICLPAEAELRARSFENYNPIVAGWGNTEFRGPSAPHLQALQLPVVSNEFCAEAYSAYKEQRIDERVLCAGYRRGGRDACQGDSGGPLMQPIWSQQTFKTYFYQIGVVSFGKRCAEAGYPGVYTRITHYVPWLQRKITGETA